MRPADASPPRRGPGVGKRERDPRLDALIAEWKRGERERWRGHGKGKGRKKK